MTYRVIQWSTGNVGTAALRCIIRHPELELVGVWVHSADKAGRDAGELCGLPPTGVLATNDVDTLIALDADCVSYTATADLRPMDAIADMARLLASGKNVVSSSVVAAIWPLHLDPSMRAPLEDACTAGGVSCFTSGIDPGWANDALPLLLAGTCEDVEQLRVMEIVNYKDY
jgi:4-hydroxy-tetrahydrodipicolinate reductase